MAAPSPKTPSKDQPENTVAARVAGEDLQCGDYVTVLNEVVELPSFLWCHSDHSLAPDEPVRFRFTPQNAGNPQKVVGVCLPFVYAENDMGIMTTFDTRRQQLVRLDRKCAKRVWKKRSGISRLFD